MKSFYRFLVPMLLVSGWSVSCVISWSTNPSCRGTRIRSTAMLHPEIERTGLLHVQKRLRLSATTNRRHLLARFVQASAVDMEQSVEPSSESSVEEAFEPLPETSPVDEETKELTKQVLNGIFLAVSFGWAAYTILNIDAGMTRGWTQSEIAMRIPLDNWSNYESSLMEKPVFTKTLINVVIYLLGDWLSQTLFQKKDILDFDVSRTLKNGFIGLCFGPLVHQYYQFSDFILPVEGGLANRVQKILMDQTIYLTVKCSIYICAVGLLSGDDWNTCKQTVKDKIGGIVITAWKFWPLVHCLTYSVIPARHRILWVNSVDLIWNAILASKAQKAVPEETELDAAREDNTHARADVVCFSSMTQPNSTTSVLDQEGTPEDMALFAENVTEQTAGDAVSQ